MRVLQRVRREHSERDLHLVQRIPGVDLLQGPAAVVDARDRAAVLTGYAGQMHLVGGDDVFDRIHRRVTLERLGDVHDQRQRDVGHDECRQGHRFITAEKHDEHQYQRDDGEQTNQPRSFFLGLELPAERHEIALRKLCFADRLPDIPDNRREWPSLRVG